jgi:hypothetical protein
MKTLKFKFIAFVLVLTAVAACSLDDGKESCDYSQTMATKVIGGTNTPTTVVNQPLQISVTFEVNNGCGIFNHFIESTGYPKNIVAQVDYTGCNCADTTTNEMTKQYTFTAATAGDYVLNFLTADADAPKVVTVHVTAE